MLHLQEREFVNFAQIKEVCVCVYNQFGLCRKGFAKYPQFFGGK